MTYRRMNRMDSCNYLEPKLPGTHIGDTGLITIGGRRMSVEIITVGDSTDHGGKVISGSPTHDIDGKPIARVGDKVACPLFYPGGKPHGINKIVTAHQTVEVGGVPVAVAGCKTECGCTLLGKSRATVG